MEDKFLMDKNIEVVNIEEEVKTSYLSYAMSVIVGRAIPDVRDGLKPVHRRILFSMQQTGNTHSNPFKKSARIVGDVIGKYHPHGDTAVYDAVVRMAQDFSLRYPLVDGQGNFGSVDGDPPAAMRYTEVRMTKIAEELLKDIEKETVDFLPNYDNSLVEPVVLPSRIPNLLINGSSGIAVGMATNIPPHNINEVIDGVIFLIENSDVKIDDLLKIVKGPDFPTGGFAYRNDNLIQAYKEGKGSVLMRARALIEEDKKGGRKIIVTEIPYTVNKSKLLEKIAFLVNSKKIDGISGLRDESDRDGMRIVIELKRDSIPQTVLNNLYKHTQLELNFGIIFLAIVDGRPRQLNLLELLRYFLSHRREVVLRRAKYELEKAEKRAHILEGLKIALSNIDEVVAIIKASSNVKEANERLRARFELSEVQAKAILDMQLQRLTNLEQEKIEQEYLELIKKIAYLKEVISNPRLVDQIIKRELIEIKEKYGDERRTEIIFGNVEEYSWSDFVKEQEFVIVYTESGYIKRTPVSDYKQKKRAAKGQRGILIKEEDAVKDLFTANSHDYLIIITNIGRAYWLRTIDIVEASLSAKGRPLVNFLPLQENEKVASLISIRDFNQDLTLFFITKKGKVKRTALKDFSNPRATGIISATLNEGDEIVDVFLVCPEDEVLLFTKKGRALRIRVKDVRVMGRTAAGVIGIRLAPDDIVLGGRKVIEDGFMFLISENGFGKKSKLSLFRGYSRGSKGVIGMRVTEKTGFVIGGEIYKEEGGLVVITEKGTSLRIDLDTIRTSGRATQGVKIIKLKKGDKTKSITRIRS
jgi:DNA gyrase subunit A